MEAWCIRASTRLDVHYGTAVILMDRQDYAISIATIHHLSTHARRKLAVTRLLECLSPTHGRALIFVWAVEQDELSKRTVPQDTENTQAEMGEDVFVPWVLPNVKGSRGESPRVFKRFYHMFVKGELRELVIHAARDLGLQVGARDDVDGVRGLEIVQDGWQRSNYYVELSLWGRELALK